MIPLSDPDATLEIPSSQVRGNMLLGFDAAGSLITILTTDIDQKLAQALAAEDSVLSMFNDPGMVIVRADLALEENSKIAKAADNKANIDIVALAITNVNAVGNNIANVNAVAANAVNINAGEEQRDQHQCSQCKQGKHRHGGRSKESDHNPCRDRAQDCCC